MKFINNRLKKLLVWRLLIAFAFSGNAYADVSDENFDDAPVANTGTQSYTYSGMTYTFNDNRGGSIEIRDVGDLSVDTSDHCLSYASTGPNTCTLSTFKTENGSEFKLNSFVISSFGDPTITISG